MATSSKADISERENCSEFFVAFPKSTLNL